jgi:hypothetical protein
MPVLTTLYKETQVNVCATKYEVKSPSFAAIVWFPAVRRLLCTLI